MSLLGFCRRAALGWDLWSPPHQRERHPAGLGVASHRGVLVILEDHADISLELNRVIPHTIIYIYIA